MALQGFFGRLTRRTGRSPMILTGIDCSEQYEAMKRGEWPEPHPAVVAAHRALEIQVQMVVDDDGEDEGEGHEESE